MDEIIDRAIRGEATPDELVRLAVWRQASTENERHFHETVALLEALGRRGARLHAEEGRRPSAAELLERRGRRDRLRRSPVLSRLRWIPWGVAAAIIVFGVVAALRSRAAPAASAWQATEVVTGAGELATVQLPDGSVARVAPRSRLRLVVTEHERVVWLEGHAFFAVAKQPGRPFRVRTREGDALALGTRFEVATAVGGLRLLVLEGRVALSGRSNETEVRGGQTAGVIDGHASPAAAYPDSARVLDWMGRFLAFQSTPLPRVAAEIERMYGVRVVLADSTLAHETVSAAFTDEPLPQVVGVVCAVIGERCSITDSVITISR